MLVHICCSVDSHYFLQKLKKVYPNERIIGYFYDPNIHPYSEFLLRYKDVKRSCKKLGIELICGDYDYESWLSGTKGLEKEPEKGKRCEYCFDFRVGNSAKMALNLGCKRLTTTLLMSPKKDFTQLKNALKNAVKDTSLEPVAVDFRKNGGTMEQFDLAKKDKLYHQNYCGCVFALEKQRAKDEIFDELFEPLGGQVQFGSIKSRLKLYKKVRKYEKNGIEFDLVRKKILNYRLKFAKVCVDGVLVPSYMLFYSHFGRNTLKFTLHSGGELINVMNEGAKLLSLAKFNELGGFDYKDVLKLMRCPPKLGRELKVRKLIEVGFSLSPIIVLDEIRAGKFEVQASSVIYPQIIEKVKI
ncbi:epoxyqueuosine reductase QueH [Campylobacter hyointestinalis]|uniref:Epoxyqueuosine reductase QueH n=1 Tax=Campylobacter hyointestinalis subsp. hyointestinalis TaxID=91352 RepID=A0A855NDR2_CAMHY|nr:epoxyqueuosine reductase QueH [Campylobacter hyointestinalis]ANE32011.1 putative DUF208 domain protein [Campylobacter hyointestinalis subsp. hyointestinalis LMG 9260]KEA44477.1 hypothetical protein CR67_04255 [Campylobacter hyointestinalis subsp. hyointestinalis]PPB57751.1 diacylglucosamine hydrolase like protein [Campylobacter hyointestinalis subsp. hyointestinalis]PPB62587.1 diacylglucosamine hydrolase like protein [Campylobacter hyointestinalis subsp. hyointestinalis]PPB71244.1 diacylglu